MVRLTLISSVAMIVGLAATVAQPTQQQRKTSRVQVHCPNGNVEAFVTPVSLTIAVGDSVEWTMAGPTPSDSIVITLKDNEQVWPFDGTPARGAASARANRARTRGTYSYNVSLMCRAPGDEMRRVVIDPDIIIE